jgi:protocatechuate 3,4-dioxygenase beta subunit
VGQVTHLNGRITDANGEPIRNAVIEIWQVDNFGSYIHSHGTNRQTNKHDGNFQGYGRFLTSSTGEYYFRTIKPVPYPGRTPHIHVKVKAKGQESLTTQIFVAGEARNRSDMVLHGIIDPKQRQSVLTDFSPIKSSTVGELAAKFDIVLGETPDA